jgi:SH3-like domain-containing protein
MDDAGPQMPRESRAPLRFSKPAARGVERRVIGYRRVRVSAGPDDLRTPQVDRIDRGDEVELLGEAEGYLHVRTPNGVEGWVPRVVFLNPPTTPGGAARPN